MIHSPPCFASACVAAALLLNSCCRADLVETFRFDGTQGTFGGVDMSTYVFHRAGLEVDGVTFDATLRVRTSHSPFILLDKDFTGLGVTGDTGLSFIDNGEWVHFTLEVTSPTGGAVPNARLSQIDYTAGPWTSTPDIFLSTDSTDLEGAAQVAPTTGVIDVVALPDGVDLESVGLELYSIAGATGSSSAHLVYGVTATFSSALAAVPEPTGFVFGGLVAMAVGGAAMRRKRPN